MDARKIWRNKDWLYQKYITEKKSLPRVAKEARCDHGTIWNWLRKFNFKIRSHSEAVSLSTSNHIKLSKIALEFLEGEILGDGHLTENSKWAATFEYSSKYLSYLQWLEKTLNSFGIKRAGKIQKRRGKIMKRAHKISIVYHYATLSYVEFHSLWEDWYRKGGADEQQKFVKIVPRDLKLSPLMCRQWFIGDGYVYKKAGIELCTQGFSIPEVHFLIQLLNNLGFFATYCKSHNSTYIQKAYKKHFLNFIGYCPEKIRDIYGYKWMI